MRLGRIRVVAVMPILISIVAAAACGAGTASPGSSSGSGSQRLEVVTTTTVFADLVTNVGGDLVNVTSLVPKNGDVHTFEPKPSNVRQVAGAKLLVMNGLGLDDWLEKTISNAAVEGTPIVKLAVDLPGVELLPGEGADTQNPHLWMDVRYAELYVRRIADALGAADPAHATTFTSQGADYVKQLEDLDARVRERTATIPAESRKVVMFHDAFPYYARAYGITIVGVAVEAPGQDPSAAYTAQLITAIRGAGVKAVFSEKQFPTRLVDQLAAETGTKVVADLYDDALSDEVGSYEALITWDTDHLVDALR